MSHANLVLAYHGCDITLRDDLVSGRTHIKPSSNAYDWLGSGIYLYEADSARAMEHASTVAQHPERLLARNPIATSAVVGVVLDVAVWLDMSTQFALKEFQTAAETCRAGFEAVGKPAPANVAAFDGDEDFLRRAFDKAAFDVLHGMRADALQKAMENNDASRVAQLQPYQAVRSPFMQGQRLANNSGFFAKNHTQIALREIACIRGYFIPAGHPQFLNQKQREEASEKLETLKKAVTAAKRRIHPSGSSR